MRAGTLRHSIDIQSKALTTDAWGGAVESWTNFATGLRADVHPLSGRELIAAQAAQSETTTRFTTRYISGVTQGMRVVYGGKYYDISAAINVNEMDRELQIMATTGMSAG